MPAGDGVRPENGARPEDGARPGGGPRLGTIRGRAWVFGDDISTDHLDPGTYAIASLEERVRHTLEPVNTRFAGEVRPGDVVVAGRNFGCGSSRETAAEALRTLGVGCVVAGSIARIFLRNAVAIGLPVLVCPGIADAFTEGDPIEVDLAGARVTNLRTGVIRQATPLPDLMREILEAGGVVPVLRRLGERLAAAEGWIADVGS